MIQLGFGRKPEGFALTVAITRTDLDADGLRAAAARSKDAAASHETLTLALMLGGCHCAEVALMRGAGREILGKLRVAHRWAPSATL